MHALGVQKVISEGRILVLTPNLRRNLEESVDKDF
jgi:hypothetical protein